MGATWLCIALFLPVVSLGTVAIGITCRGDTLPNLCPANCSCCLSEYDSLLVTCSQNISTNLTQSVNVILQEHSNLTRLEVSNSSLSTVERLKLCQLRNLTHLTLSSNSLTTLGNRTLSCLKELVEITASDNAIQHIDEETFSGLSHLQRIELTRNRIHSVHPTAFTILPEIQYVGLRENRLESVDAWPIYITVDLPRYTEVNLQENHIKGFTNYLNWTYQGFKGAHGELNLKGNCVIHLVDIFLAWSILSPLEMLLLFKAKEFHVDLRDNCLKCDCVDFDIIKFLVHVKRSPKVHELRCREPPNYYDRVLVTIPLSEFVCDVKANCTAGCECVEQPTGPDFNINCQSLELQSLPHTVPTHTTGYYNYNFRFNLNLQHNNITSVEPREYYRHVNKTDLSYNRISDVSIQALEQLRNIQKLYLHNNKLKTMPQEVQQLSFPFLQSLSLHDNPWNCFCDNDLWFKHWLQNHSSVLLTPAAINCAQPSYLEGRSLLEVSDHDFCHDPAQEARTVSIAISVSIIGVLLLVVIIPVLILYCNRKTVYQKYKWHLFDWDECEGEKKQYDIFLSSAEEDRAWVEVLLQQLECHGFRVLYHRRDFRPGMPITENIGKAIDASKRTLCVLTPNFVKSHMCMWEFSTALNIDLQEKRHRLIILYKEMVTHDNLGTSMRDYLRNFTYIEPDSEHFTINLMYSLPVRKFGSSALTTFLTPDRDPGDEDNTEEGGRDTEPLLQPQAAMGEG